MSVIGFVSAYSGIAKPTRPLAHQHKYFLGDMFHMTYPASGSPRRRSLGHERTIVTGLHKHQPNSVAIAVLGYFLRNVESDGLDASGLIGNRCVVWHTRVGCVVRGLVQGGRCTVSIPGTCEKFLGHVDGFER